MTIKILEYTISIIVLSGDSYRKSVKSFTELDPLHEFNPPVNHH